VVGHQGTAQQDINEHLFSLSAWRQFFESQNLEIVQVIPDRWHSIRWRKASGGSPVRFLSGPLLEVAWRLVPLAWQYQFVFLLRRSRSTPPTAP